jgi:CopG family nickel-responsive transcriptional regulator
MQRYAITIADELAEKFELHLKQEGYANRSAAISNIITHELARSNWCNDNHHSHRKLAATISLIYDHHKGPIIKKLNDLQHHYPGLIQCTQHVHVGHSDCLEVIICRGSAKNIKNFYNDLKKIKPIKSHTLSVMEYSEAHTH